MYYKEEILLRESYKHGTKIISILVVMVIVVLGGVGCSSQPKTVQSAPQIPSVQTAPPQNIELADESKLANAMKEGDIPEEDRNKLPWLPKRPPLGMQFAETSELQTVYFEFDKYSLTSQTKEALNRNAEWLKNHADVSVQIEGHCDERGTLEYNQVLGENRAMSTKKYLVSLGIVPDRLYTISYGKAKPVDPGHTEEAWAKNRRAEFKIGRTQEK